MSFASRERGTGKCTVSKVVYIQYNLRWSCVCAYARADALSPDLANTGEKGV